MIKMIHIDGRRGEGGGQVLRTALALSVVTGRGFHIDGIRARRSNPGLAPQHLQAVRIFREVSQATCEGDEIGSQALRFLPGPVKRGAYRVDIGTAGSVTLVLQALAIPLALAEGSSEIALHGGTHVPWSPPLDYVLGSWLPSMSRIGIRMEIRSERSGFYPKGGGEVRARIEGGAQPRALRLIERGALRSLEIASAAARLPSHVRDRQARAARRGLQGLGMTPSVRFVELEAVSPGSVVAVMGVFENVRVVASALGARGKRAEVVGEEAASAFRFYIGRPGAADRYLGDQLVLPLALADGASTYTTVEVTQHLVTHVEVIRAFLSRKIDVEGELGEPGRVSIQ